ncbi:AbrB/MazE/SpoVT family DNA-binding domain-containing protein [Rhizobium sp. TH2]|uniref:antitoxin n=1 Tax=Rhizobium sp. TH2 TaxID=2775403 RepID=UPI0021588BA4|nr:AbrB/MazE/SpoVT family DNA-binding domain-containing protein [Rhizobium sp. TH2]UVC07692.1 AbrB/MazE/SpoVT family DNA-binding domain-containing protein [Rhizobium sp. TH2]
MNEHTQIGEDSEGITVNVFNNGRSRAIRIPKEFEFASKTVVMSQQPDGSILMRAGETSGLVDYLKTAEPWNGEAFLPDDDGLAPLDEIDLP